MSKEYGHNRFSYMMLCVVAQAVRDALLTRPTKSSSLNIHRAKYWLLEDDKDFFFVCACAEISGQRIRKKVQELYAMPYEQRRAEVNRLMRDCYEWNKSSANKGKSKKYF